MENVSSRKIREIKHFTFLLNSSNDLPAFLPVCLSMSLPLSLLLPLNLTQTEARRLQTRSPPCRPIGACSWSKLCCACGLGMTAVINGVCHNVFFTVSHYSGWAGWRKYCWDTSYASGATNVGYILRVHILYKTLSLISFSPLPLTSSHSPSPFHFSLSPLSVYRPDFIQLEGKLSSVSSLFLFHWLL